MHKCFKVEGATSKKLDFGTDIFQYFSIKFL